MALLRNFYFLLFKKKFVYLFGCSRPQLWHVGSLIFVQDANSQLQHVGSSPGNSESKPLAHQGSPSDLLSKLAYMCALSQLHLPQLSLCCHEFKLAVSSCRGNCSWRSRVLLILIKVTNNVSLKNGSR